MRHGVVAAAVLGVVVLGLPRLASAGEKKPIVAVFGIEDKGTGLADELLGRLTDYLASSLAATGVYQVIPRSQIKERLVEQKEGSYKSCYDQQCQIEIGKELAAQKSLSTQVIKLGSRCMVTAVLYDLKKATSEGGARAEGGCTEDEIVKSILSTIAELVPKKVRPVSPRPAPPATPPAQREVVSIDLKSDPPQAEVFIDGRSYGKTPIRVDLAKGQFFAALFEKAGYQSVKKAFEAADRTIVSVNLEMTEEAGARQKTRTEWVALEPWMAIGSQGVIGGGASLRLITLKWERFFLTCLEGGGGGGNNEFIHGHVGPALGYPLYLGAGGRHQLRFGLGVGVVFVYQRVPHPYGSGTSEEALGLGFGLTPTVQYLYQSRGRFFVGASLRVALPVAGVVDYSPYPFAVVIAVPLGFASAGK